MSPPTLVRYARRLGTEDPRRGQIVGGQRSVADSEMFSW